MKVYLDYAAATPITNEVKMAMKPFFSESFYNPSSTYLVAQEAKKSLNEARKTIARNLGAKPNEIIFTAGATESDNLAVKGVLEAYPAKNIIISSIEHEAVREPASSFDCRIVSVNNKGLVDLEELKSKIDEETVLVSIIYANNEIGTIQSLPKISEIVNSVREERKTQDNKTPIYLHTDAVQAANYLSLQVSKLGVDLMTLSAAKVYGPKQVGCLYVRAGVEIMSQITGGGQEKNLRSGTENVAGAVGFAKALDTVQLDKKTEGKRVADLRDKLQKHILSGCTNAEVVGGAKKRLPNNLNVHFAGVDGERLLMLLDEKGVMVATGAACDAAKDGPSHVLMALGLSQDQAASSLRISLGRLTTEEQIEYAGKTIVDAVSALSQN